MPAATGRTQEEHEWSMARLRGRRLPRRRREGMIERMRAIIIAVGNELLGADRADTNSLFLADVLARSGVEVSRKVIIGDRLEDLALEIGRAISEVSLVLITGGLGPTQDDLTREAVAHALDRGLERDPAIIEDIRAKFAAFGREMAPVNERQADVIEGAEVLDNQRGTAPGLRLESNGTTLFLFPGVPSELRGLVESELDSWLASEAPGGEIERRIFRVACIPESDLEERLVPFYEEFGTDGVSVLPSPGEVVVRLTRGGTVSDRSEWFDRREVCLGDLLGQHVFSRSETGSLEMVVGDLLRSAGRTVVTAESCTGGGVAARLTSVDGSSAYFLGGAVTYSNDLKMQMLGVPAAELERFGAVSREVAGSMALGARERLGADYGLAVTGIAGPSGGTQDKPVGTVFIALAGPGAVVEGDRFLFPGTRSRVRRLTTQWALDLLRRTLLKREGQSDGADVGKSR